MKSPDGLLGSGWLQKNLGGAKRRRLDALTLADIDAKIAAHRRSEKQHLAPGVD